MTELMSTGEAARRLGVSTSLLRKLEATGVVTPARRLTGFDRRVYSQKDLEVLRRIIVERRAGMSQQAARAA